MLKKLFLHLTQIKPRDRLPKWNGLTVEFDARQLSVDEQLILQAGLARDMNGAQLLMKEKGVTSAYELNLMRSAPRVDARRRFKMWLMRLFGETPTDRVLGDYFRGQRDQMDDLYDW
jgi:hypothetical protein